MDLREYQSAAREFAEGGPAVVYAAVGLIGETGEVAELIKKWLRDEGGGAAMSSRRREKLRGELGDALRFACQLACDVGVDLASACDCPPCRRPGLPLAHLAVALGNEVGRAVAVVDEWCLFGGQIDAGLMAARLRRVYFAWADIAEALNLSPAEVMRAGAAKMSRRAAERKAGRNPGGADR